MTIKVTIDRALCQGHGQCEETAPDIFQVRDDGLSYVIREVGADALDLAGDAASRCPVGAITVDEE
jgi:ferredoxin